MRFAAVIAFCLLPLPLANAEPARQQVVIPSTAIVPVVVQVPTYSVSYNSDTAAIVAELRAIRRELEAMRGGSQPLSLAGVFSQRCASCHASGVSASKGAGISLLDAAGKVPPLSVLEKRAIKKAIRTNMPKGDKPLDKVEIDFIDKELQ